MKYIYLFQFIIFCFQDCNSCKTSSPNCLVTYSFNIPIEILPLSDTLNIGDTLWIHSVIPADLEDLNSGELIDVLNFDFQLISTINKMDTLGAPDAEFDFEWINKTGHQDILSSGPYFLTQYNYEIGDTEKKLMIGLICQKKGLYQIAFTYLNENLTNVNLTPDDCIQNIKLRNILDDGEDNNFYLLENNQNPISNSVEDFKRDAGYAFIVAE